MAYKFVTVKGASSLATAPFYIGIPQHERIMPRKETYKYLEDRTGYKATAIRAVFMGLAAFVAENAAKGNITQIDGVASIRNLVKGSFDGLTGPWVKGRNYLLVASYELDPFKSILADVVPLNRTEGARPIINTVYDETTQTYGVITGTDVFSIAGSDLGPDEAKSDEYVALVAEDGTETKCEITYSDLQNVKAKLGAALPEGEYVLKVYTRSGLGVEFGVKCVSRKVEVK